MNFIEVTSTEVTRQCAAASDSIQEITSSSLMKLRTSKNPSPQLLSILDVVLLVLRKEIYSGDNVFSSTEMEQKDDKIRGRSKFKFSSKLSIAFLRKRNFLDLLKSVTRDMINAETAELISPYFVKLTELKMEDTSNVSPLLKWTVHMQTSSNLVQEIKAMEDIVRIDIKATARLENELNACKNALQQKVKIIENIKSEIFNIKSEIKSNEKSFQDTGLRVKSMKAFFESFASIRMEWVKRKNLLSQRLDNLKGDTAISTIFLVYIGNLQENRRNGLLEIALKSYLKHGFASNAELGEAYSKFDANQLSDIMRQQFLTHYIEEEWKYGGLVASDSIISSMQLVAIVYIPNT